MSDGMTRNPDQCGGRGTAPMPNLAVNCAIRRSSTKRPSSGRDCSEAQAPIWLVRGRVAK
jgi:hypothetical protein